MADTAGTAYAPAVLLRILRWHTTHEPVYMRGVSEAAIARIRQFLEKAETADPTWFKKPSFVSGTQTGGSGEARRNLRYLATLVPRDVPEEDLAHAVWAVLGNPYMTVEDVAEILEGHSTEYTGTVLREAGTRLREGQTRAQVAKDLGVGLKMARQVAQFLGTDEAQAEALREHALRFLDERGEHSPYVFSAETGVSLQMAKKVLNAVKKGLRDGMGTA